MSVIGVEDTNGRRVVIHVQPMRGAIVTVTRFDRHGKVQTRISVPLSQEDCKLLAEAFTEGS